MTAWGRYGRAFGIVWAVLGWGSALAQAPVELIPNDPPLRPELGPLLALHDGDARLVPIEPAPEPRLGGQGDRLFNYLTASDGTVYRVMEGAVYCWLPGTEGDAARFEAPRGATVAGLVDDLLVGWSARTFPGGRQLVEQRYTACGPDFAPSTRVLLHEDGPDLPLFVEPWPKRTSGELWQGPDGVCTVSPVGVGCLGGSADAPVYTTWLSAAEMAERLPRGADFVRELLAGSAPQLDPDGEITYALRDAQRLPDGRIGAILSAALPRARNLSVDVNWAVLLDPAADTVEDLLEPTVQVLGGGFPYDNPLGLAETIHYDAEWDALWVGRVVGWQPSSLILSFDTVGSFNDLLTKGRTGMGYRVLPLSGPHAGGTRNGYMDLTNAMFWLNPCENERRDGCAPFVRLGFTALTDRAGQMYFKPSLNLPPRRLVFDRDAVDLDGDGLDRAAEEAQGTSDFDPDSDDDGAFDGVEALVGRPPAASDPSPQHQTVKRFTFTDVWAQVPDVPEGTTQAHSYAPNNPLCEYQSPLNDAAGARRRGRCHDPAGRILVEWTTDTTLDRPIISADGRYVLFTRFDGVYQLPFDTGEPELWISAADLHARIGDAITGGADSGFAALQHWVPVDRETLFLGTALDPFSPIRKGTLPRYERLDGAPGGPVTFTRLFDSEFDFCDAGLVGCSDEELDHIGPGNQTGPITGMPYERSLFWTVAMGYHHELQRFLVGVGGHQQSVILGFHRDASEPPVRVSRARGLYPMEREAYLVDVAVDWCVPFPGTVHAVQPGLYMLGHTVWRGPALERVPVGYHPAVTAEAQACGSGTTRPFVAPWGPLTAFGQLVSGRTVSPIEPLRVDPGDTLLLSSPGSDAASGVTVTDDPGARMLYALGPWVNLRPLWDAPDPDLVRGTGLAVAEDLRVCIADRPGQQVLEYLPEPETNRPTGRGRRVTDLDAIDCAWRGGELLVLTGDAVVAIEDGGAVRVLREHGATQPVRLAVDDQGEIQVLDRATPDAPAGWIQRQDGRLDPIAPDALREGPFNSEIRIEIDARQPSTVFHAVERPDGTVLISHTSTLAEPDPYGVEIFGIHQGVLLLDGRGGLRTVANPIGMTGGELAQGQFVFQPIAQVPGDGPDLWQGAKGPVCWFDASLPECVVDRSGPEGPTPGGPDAGPGAGGDQPADDGGCQCAAQGGGAPSDGLWLLALWGLRRRRRRVA